MPPKVKLQCRVVQATFQRCPPPCYTPHAVLEGYAVMPASNACMCFGKSLRHPHRWHAIRKVPHSCKDHRDVFSGSCSAAVLPAVLATTSAPCTQSHTAHTQLLNGSDHSRARHRWCTSTPPSRATCSVVALPAARATRDDESQSIAGVRAHLHPERHAQ
eukprot:365837-Chlamydomonas_euryale.AAC.13